MKNWTFTLGIDVSKATLDIHCAELNIHTRVENGSAGFKLFYKWCRHSAIDLNSSMIAMEHTGGYEYKLMQFCESKQLSYCRLSGLAIKHSLGIVRGKCDQVDAKRIAQYATEKHAGIKAAGPVNITILSLKQLLSFRKRLVREVAGYKASLKERKEMYGAGKQDVIIKMLSRKIKENDKLIKQIGEEISSLVESDQEILKTYKILSSMKGIGTINALMTIAYTENFTCFSNPRAYAVYVGVVPFDYSSGSSIKGRKRVSHLANKELKQELNQAARSAIGWNKDIREYAEEKLKTKPYKIVLNNVKFKLILRMFSLVKRGEFYVDNYNRAA